MKLIWEKICSFSYIFVPLFPMRPTTESSKITHKRENFETTRKNIALTKYLREKYLDPRDVFEKNVGPTKYPREKMRHGGTMVPDPRDPRWYATNKI